MVWQKFPSSLSIIGWIPFYLLVKIAYYWQSVSTLCQLITQWQSSLLIYQYCEFYWIANWQKSWFFFNLHMAYTNLLLLSIENFPWKHLATIPVQYSLNYADVSPTLSALKWQYYNRRSCCDCPAWHNYSTAFITLDLNMHCLFLNGACGSLLPNGHIIAWHVLLLQGTCSLRCEYANYNPYHHSLEHVYWGVDSRTWHLEAKQLSYC